MQSLVRAVIACSVLWLVAACKAPDVNSDWMAAYPERTLAELTLPASHDAGLYKPFPASELTQCKGGAFFNIAITQTWDILGQLKMGARYFDIRPVLSGGTLYTAHGTKERIDALGLSLNAGCRGQAIDSVFAQVKTFLDAHPGEVVVLNVSHVDYGAGMFSDATPAQVDAALKQSAEAHLGNVLFRPGDFPSTSLKPDIWNMRLGDIVAQNRRAIVAVECAYAEPARGFVGCAPQGVSGALSDLTGSWANSPSATTVVSRVEQSWRNHLAAGNTSGFDLSWTATMDTNCIAGAFSYKLFGVPLSRMPGFMKTLLAKAGIATEGYDQCRSIRTMSAPLADLFAPTMTRWKNEGLLCANRRPRVVSTDFTDSVLTTEIVRLNDLTGYPVVAGCP